MQMTIYTIASNLHDRADFLEVVDQVASQPDAMCDHLQHLLVLGDTRVEENI